MRKSPYPVLFLAVSTAFLPLELSAVSIGPFPDRNGPTAIGTMVTDDKGSVSQAGDFGFWGVVAAVGLVGGCAAVVMTQTQRRRGLVKPDPDMIRRKQRAGSAHELPGLSQDAVAGLIDAFVDELPEGGKVASIKGLTAWMQENIPGDGEELREVLKTLRTSSDPKDGKLANVFSKTWHLAYQGRYASKTKQRTLKSELRDAIGEYH